MKTAIAIWNYCWNAEGLPAWIDHFADHGFDAVSFHPQQFAGESARHLAATVDVLRNRHLAATVHGSVSMDTQLMTTMVRAMNDRLFAFTLDSCLREDSRGIIHDAGRIAAALSQLQALTADSDVWIAVEDFPLDEMALAHFGTELGAVYDHPRTGILIDVGHMHMKMQKSDYFRPLSVGEYFRRLPCRLVELHLHDNDGMKDQHGHLGFGTVPFSEIAMSVREMGFSGVCTIEIAPTFHGSTPEESKARAVQSLDLWRNLMQGAGEPVARGPETRH